MANAFQELGSRLAADLTTLAICWQIIRSDGVALGFTTHDRSLLVAGMAYESAPGITPSAVVASDGLDVDVMDVAGALSADAIRATDLAQGRFDGAAVRIFMVDWQEPDAGQQLLAGGRLGTVDAGTGPDAGFTASLRGSTARFSATLIESCSPECRAELGDRRCRVAMRGRTLRTRVLASAGHRLTLAGIEDDTIDQYIEGGFRVLEGRSAGLEGRILATDGSAMLADTPVAMPPGTLVQLWQGCDKRFATCVGRFENAANFRGEPHVPGNDLLTRFVTA
jgi:uncharacterized phage protein (TIGR02218 family)